MKKLLIALALLALAGCAPSAEPTASPQPSASPEPIPVTYAELSRPGETPTVLDADGIAALWEMYLGLGGEVVSRPDELLYSVSFYDDDASPAVELSIYEGDIVYILRRGSLDLVYDCAGLIDHGLLESLYTSGRRVIERSDGDILSAFEAAADYCADGGIEIERMWYDGESDSAHVIWSAARSERAGDAVPGEGNRMAIYLDGIWPDGERKNQQIALSRALAASPWETRYNGDITPAAEQRAEDGVEGLIWCVNSQMPGAEASIVMGVYVETVDRGGVRTAVTGDGNYKYTMILDRNANTATVTTEDLRTGEVTSVTREIE